MDLSAVPAIERPERTFSDRTVVVLRELVLDGRLRAGGRINEVELSAALGISRGPLREAIQHLRSEGLLTTISHRGAFVRTFSERELSDLYEVRIALETHAVKLAARSVGETSMADLYQRLAEAEQGIGEAGRCPAELGFHQRIVSLADSQALSDAVVDVHRKIPLARSRSGHDRSRASGAPSEHGDVLVHLAHGDGDKAAEVLETHIRSSLEGALTLLRADGAGHTADHQGEERGGTTRRTRRRTDDQP